MTKRKSLPPLDALLDGGMTPGHVYLLGGPKGSGKSALALQIAQAFVEESKRPALYNSSEMGQDVLSYCARLDVRDILVDIHNSLDDILAAAEEKKAKLLVIDSIHTTASMGDKELTHITAQAAAWFAKKRGINVILLAHFNKQGDFDVDDRVLHAVDVIARLDYEDDDMMGNGRVLSVEKRVTGGSIRLEMTSSGFRW